MRECENSWIRTYLEYTKGQEAPELFHIWVAMVLIASALDRGVKRDRGHFDLYPNLFVILVAGAARCRKSTALRMGRNILEDSQYQSLAKNETRVFAQKITNERLLQFLGEGAETDIEEGQVQFKASGLISASELSSFLGRGSMNSGLISTLTDLYDCPDDWKYETKTSDDTILNNVYLNMIGASTGKWLRSAIPEEAVGGGFISRCIFVYRDEPRKPIPFPEDHLLENHDEIKEKLVKDLAEISNLEGEISFTDEAREWYRKWYKDDAETEEEGSMGSDFFSRWSEHVLKVSMLYSVAESNDLIVQKKHLTIAEGLLSDVKESMKPVIDTMTVSDSELPTNKVLGIIRRRKEEEKEIDHQSLAKLTSRFVRSEGLQEIINTLEEAGEVETIFDSEGGREKRRYKYVGDN